MKRVGLAVVALASLLLIPASSALAKGPPVSNMTMHFHDVMQTFDDVDPCTGQPAEITTTFSGVAHLSLFQDGSGHFTETDRGTFTLDYIEQNSKPDGDVDASGTFVDWDGGNGFFDQNGNPTGKGEQSFTLNGSGTFTDSGAPFRFHNNGHAVFDQFANPKIMFFKAHCH